MTKREFELLSLIEANPLISQKELATALGIERSSVAVHISNLIKKGIIKGKGYIVSTQPYIAVIGGANMDLLGTPEGHLTLEDSNPGIITASPGGVGRNIAENIARLGLSVKLFTTVGEDPYGSQLIEATKSAGVDTHYIKRTTEMPTSTYMSVLDETGEMRVALSDMRSMQTLTVDYIKNVDDILKQAQLLVIDTNLDEQVLTHIVTNYRDIPIIVDTVSTAKAKKILPLLSFLYCIKPNRLEAEILWGRSIRNEQDLTDALMFFSEKGITVPMISFGKEGVYYLNDGKLRKQEQKKVSVINANGAGDAFIAGIAYGLFQQSELEDTVAFATATAALALEVPSTVNQTLSVEAVQSKLQQ